MASHHVRDARLSSLIWDRNLDLVRIGPSMKVLIQVLARLKPGQCGLSDHAIALAHELHVEFGIDTVFVVLNSTERCESPYPAHYCTPAELLQTCSSMSNGRQGNLLLHYSGYGFSRDGAPYALAEAMRAVRESGVFRSGIYFHELFAMGMPWKSAFWHSHRQREVARRLACQCDVVATNLGRHAEWLEREGMKGIITPLQRMPVFSNIGEAADVPPMSNRLPTMIVFGLPGTRQRSYQRLSSFRRVIDDVGVEEILDIGPECDAPSNICGISVRRMGIVPAERLSGILSRARFGFVPHPSFCLAKSGIFAGFCALGTIPFLSEPFEGEVDGLKDGVHLVSAKTVKTALSSGLDRCSKEAWEWYSGHKLRVHAEMYARHLVPSPIEAGRIQRSAVAGKA